MRICNKCHEEKDDLAFGVHLWCKQCFAAYTRERHASQSEDERRKRLNKRNEWVEKNRASVRAKERLAARKRYKANPDKKWENKLKSVYHINAEQWFDMFEQQNGLCGICKKPPIKGQRRFAIDHDHNCCPDFGSCGNCIRGLLCAYCNTKIEFAVSNIEAIHEWIKK